MKTVDENKTSGVSVSIESTTKQSNEETVTSQTDNKKSTDKDATQEKEAELTTSTPLQIPLVIKNEKENKTEELSTTERLFEENAATIFPTGEMEITTLKTPSSTLNGRTIVPEESTEIATLEIEGREGLGEEITVLPSLNETASGLQQDETTSNTVVTETETTTVKALVRAEISSSSVPSAETTREIKFETTTSSPVLDLTTTRLVLVKDIKDDDPTTSEPELTTLAFRIQEVGEPDKEATTLKSFEVEGGEKEFVMVEDDKAIKDAAGKNQTLHTLKCHPTSNVTSQPGTIPMECQDEATAIEPIIVIISADGLGLDLEHISRNNIKVVVKEFMLMEMQQIQAPKK